MNQEQDFARAVWLTVRWHIRAAMELVRLAVRYWRGVLVGASSSVIAIATHSWLVGFLVFCLLIGFATTRSSQRIGKGWWSPVALSQALIDAGIVRGPDVTLVYRGKPKHTEHGTTVTVMLPQARSLSDAAGRREQLASALGVPLARLEVFQHEDDPANLVTLHVTRARPGSARASIATADQAAWLDPIRMGINSRGEPVWYATFEHNGLVAGRPGSGKTGFARIVLAHALLDPTATVCLLDGKGSRRDYGECRPFCSWFVLGTDDDAVPDTLEMLTQVLAEVRRRNTHGGRFPGILLLLEELQDVRASASREQRDLLDTVLGRIVRMGRAVNVHVLVSTQRPTVDDLPAGTRNLLSQRVALMLRNSEDTKLVLGMAPSMGLPSSRGQALYTDGGPVVSVILDRLTDEDWARVCVQAGRLRPGWTQPTQGLPELPEQATQPIAMDPLLEAVVEVLGHADPRGLSASELQSRLPGWTHEVCPDGHSLGLKLAKHPTVVQRAHIGSIRGWRLTDRKAGVG